MRSWVAAVRCGTLWVCTLKPAWLGGWCDAAAACWVCPCGAIGHALLVLGCSWLVAEAEAGPLPRSLARWALPALLSFSSVAPPAAAIVDCAALLVPQDSGCPPPRSSPGSQSLPRPQAIPHARPRTPQCHCPPPSLPLAPSPWQRHPCLRRAVDGVLHRAQQRHLRHALPAAGAAAAPRVQGRRRGGPAGRRRRRHRRAARRGGAGPGAAGGGRRRRRPGAVPRPCRQPLCGLRARAAASDAGPHQAAGSAPAARAHDWLAGPRVCLFATLHARVWERGARGGGGSRSAVAVACYVMRH